MRISSVLVLIVIVVVATFLITPAALSPGAGKFKTPDELTVEFKADGDKLTVTSPDCSDSKKGCLKIKKNRSGIIKYVYSDPSNTWRLREFKICKGTVNTNAEKPALDCDLGLWERLEFFVVKDLNNASILNISDQGVIRLNQLPAGTKQFYLLDQNDIKQDYFYTIKACKIADEENCISTDPPIQNGGRGQD